MATYTKHISQRGLARRPMAEGLTLIEALVAITVLSVGVLGPLTIAARGIGDGLFARNQLAANYLAQEALELIVNRRYYLASYGRVYQPTDGFTIFNDPASEAAVELDACLQASVTDEDQYCSLDPEAVDAQTGFLSPNCHTGDSSIKNCQLVFDAGSGADVYHPRVAIVGEESGPVFTRLLRLEHPDGDINRLRATVTVNWQNKDTPKSLTLVEYLYGL